MIFIHRESLRQNQIKLLVLLIKVKKYIVIVKYDNYIYYCTVVKGCLHELIMVLNHKPQLIFKNVVKQLVYFEFP